MKKIAIIAILLLVGLNLLIVPLLSTGRNINNAINDVAASTPSDTIYIKSNENFNDNDNATLIAAAKSLEGVESVTAYDTYQTATSALTYGGEIPDTNKVEGRYSIPVIALDSADDQKYPIIAGRNLAGNNEVVISSSLVDHLGLSPEEVINSSAASMSVVGVYQDPIPYQTNRNLFSSSMLGNNDIDSANQAYTVDQNIKVENKNQIYTISDEGEEITQAQQVIEIVFDNDNTEANLTALINKLGEDQVYFSTLGLKDENDNFSSLYSLTIQNQNIKRTLIVTDIVSIGLIILFIRKDSNGISKKSA